MSKSMKIAGSHTIKQWEDLVSVLNKNDNKYWELAFSFFEERIETRYLKPIEAILKMGDNKGEGFAVVNLQCSLIETIESFINGWIYNNIANKDEKIKANRWYYRKITERTIVNEPKLKKEDLKNVDIFVSFFENRIPFKNLFSEQDKAKSFFWNVRCGLLHETQTKNGWKIRARNEEGTESITKDKIIYRTNFDLDIKKVIESYKSAIVKGEDFDDNISIDDLKQNFIDKFNHICTKS